MSPIDPSATRSTSGPTADEMLARVRAEAATGRGRLRVYLGMAPGRRQDLPDARGGPSAASARGTDLVVGFVEAHGRPRHAELLDGLEVVPRRRIEYRGVVVEEMDTDAVIARRPTVALVDELAHTNVPGLGAREALAGRRGHPRRRHPRRQHAATSSTSSRVADAVATITGAPVNERLPDDVLLDAPTRSSSST